MPAKTYHPKFIQLTTLADPQVCLEGLCGVYTCMFLCAHPRASMQAQGAYEVSSFFLLPLPYSLVTWYLTELGVRLALTKPQRRSFTYHSPTST